jgi:two-component system cell cycle response regulator DivK
MAHVLVVEDDRMNAKLFEVILRRRGGFEVTVTEDVQELLRLAENRAVDVIIMDISLANSRHEGKSMDGVQITRKLKDDPRTAGIPVILATAHAMRGDRERFLEASKADDYIAKPVVDQEKLIQKVQSFLKKKDTSRA